MTLKDRFKKYSPDIRFEKIMNEGIVRRTRVDSEQKIVEVDVSFNCIFSKQDVLYPLEKALKQEYKLNNVFINPKYSPELFDDSYINQIMIEARRRKFVSDLLLKNYKFSLSENDLMIETNYGEGGAELMKCCGAEKNIASIIFSEFGLSINVIIIASDKQNEEYKKYLERLTKETFEQSSRQIFKSINNTKKSAGAFDTVTAIEGDSNGCIHAGKLVFDISEATLACGKEFIINPVPIASCTSPESAVVIIGTIYSYDLRETRRGNKTAVFSLSDEEASVTVKCRNRKLPEFFKLTNGISVALKGDLAFDDFDGELTFTPESMKYIKEVPRMDKYDGEKRVELHLHSTMSTMDAILTPTQAVQTAFRWGHRAVAITDHGTAQGFPEAMKASEKLGMKVIYGMEGYLVDDEAKAIYGSSEEDTRLDGEFVVFDIETTGLSPLSCGITEIGAVFVNHGEIESVFSTFVNPGIPIPAEITKLTGINDEMVSDAPSPAEAVKNFLEFSQNKTLVAHNANFDISFIRRACENAGIPFNPVYLDTVSISRFINPELKNHKLDTLANYTVRRL